MATVSDLLRQVGALYGATTSTQDLDFFNKRVQYEDDPNFVSSPDATIIFSGPPVLNAAIAGLTGGIASLLVPIGAVQGFSSNQQAGVQPYPEVGSRLKRRADGQANYSIQIARVNSYHSNILHAFYAWLGRMPGGTELDFRFKPGEEAGVDGVSGGHLTTLESDLFRVPFGLMKATITAGGRLVSREYWEQCAVMTEGDNVSAGGALIQENVSIFATRKVPAPNIAINLAMTNINSGIMSVIEPSSTTV